MSRKSAPPRRRVSSDTGPDAYVPSAARSERERYVRCGAEPRAAQGRRGGGEAAARQTEPGTATAHRLPNGGGEADGQRPAPEDRERSERAAPWRGRAGPSPPRTGPRWRARGARGEATRADASRAAARQSRRLAGTRTATRHALPNGAARRGQGRGTSRPNTQRRRRATAAGRRRRRRARSGAAADPGRRHTRPTGAASTPRLRSRGEAERDGQAATARGGGDEATAPGRRGAGERRGGGGARGGRGHHRAATARSSRGPIPLAGPERTGEGRKGKEKRVGSPRAGRQRGISPPERPLHRPVDGPAETRAKRRPAFLSSLPPPENHLRISLAEAPGPRRPQRPRPTPLVPRREDLGSSLSSSRAHAARTHRHKHSVTHPRGDSTARAARAPLPGDATNPSPTTGAGPRGDTHTAGGRFSGLGGQDDHRGRGRGLSVRRRSPPGRGGVAHAETRGCGRNTRGGER